MELQTPVFNQFMPTFPGFRHGSTLCLIPMWHFGFLIIDKRRPTWLLIALTSVQLAVLILAIRIRSSAIWAVIFLIALTAITIVKASRPRARSGMQWVQIIYWWPAVMVTAGLLANQAYMAVKIHPVYWTDDVLPSHGLWHSAYLGFGWAPELYGFAMPKEIIGTDEVGVRGAFEYMRSFHLIGADPIGYTSPWTGTQKFRLHDQMMRRAVLRILMTHPFKSLRLYVRTKPLATWRLLVKLLRTSSPLLVW
jgi:hypothetical protein